MYVAATELARKRIERGLKQKELASQLGIHPSTLSNVENGWRQSWPKLRRECSRILEVPVEELFPPDEKRDWSLQTSHIPPYT